MTALPTDKIEVPIPLNKEAIPYFITQNILILSSAL